MKVYGGAKVGRQGKHELEEPGGYLQHALHMGEMTNTSQCLVMVLLYNGDREIWGIILVEVICKLISTIINMWLNHNITLYDFLHYCL